MTNEKRRTPELRFPGFTDDWEQRKLSEIGNIVTGSTPKTSDTNNYGGEYLFISPVDIQGNRYIDSTLTTLTKKGFDTGRKIRPGASMFVSIGSTIGKVAQTRIESTSNQQINAVEPFDNYDDDFVFTLLESKADSIKAIASNQAVPIVNKTTFGETDILLPNNKEEQSSIGKCFRILDNLITLHQRKLDQMKEYKKGMLQKMFPAKGASVPELRFPGFTDDWEQRKVSDLFKVTRGYVLAAPETDEVSSDEKPYPVYSSQTKNNGLMGYYKDYLYEDAITWTTDGANAGTVCYRAGKFYCTNVCGVLLSDEGYANKMVAEALNSIACKHVSRVGNPKLMNNVMSEIEVYLPKDIVEQKRISDILTEFDNLITLHQRKLDHIKEYKKGLLQKMFV